MLTIDINAVDEKGKHCVARIAVLMAAPSPKVKNAYYYEYQATIYGKTYTGTVLHSRINGSVALTQKVTKAVLAQQKADRKAAQK